MKQNITVVIPFYQQQPGLLARALHSVTAQQVDATLRVVVVDDESPVPAQDDIKQAVASGLNVTVIRQRNAGPGAARNAALNTVGGAGDLVAFLDSDDMWRPQHLARALRALDAGHDVYFSNFMQLDAAKPAFERAGRLAGVEHAAEHVAIDEGDGLWSYRGDMITQVVVGNLIGTPTVVYRPQRFPKHRFRTEYRRAGEDYLFWLGLAALGAKFCFGTVPMVDCGRGVNVYSGSGWGTDGFARRLFDERAYRVACERDFALSPRAQTHVVNEKRRLAKAFSADLLHRLRHRKPVDWQLVRAYWLARWRRRPGA